MKNYFKYITIILVAFVMMIGINVKADDYLYSGGSDINIIIPIHKTDSNKKGLEGAEFTLKDFNNVISYKSDDKEDGDYLIEVSKSNYPETIDRRYREFRVEDYTSDDEVLTEIFDIIPTKYSDVFRKAESAEDFFKMLELPVLKYDYSDNFFSVGFYIPLKIEETKVPTGYKAKNIIIPAFVYFNFYGDDGEYILYGTIGSVPGDYSDAGVPAYFEYEDGTDYEKIFDNINNNLEPYYLENSIKLFEENGAIIDKDCDMEAPPLYSEDLEGRFSDDILDLLCPINIIDEKEVPIVNPETAGVIGIIVLLIVIAFVTKVTAKKIRDK